MNKTIPQLLLTPEQAADTLAIGRTRVYSLMRSGAINSVRIGTSRRISFQALRAYVATLEKQAGSVDDPSGGHTGETPPADNDSGADARRTWRSPPGSCLSQSAN